MKNSFVTCSDFPIHFSISWHSLHIYNAVMLNWEVISSHGTLGDIWRNFLAVTTRGWFSWHLVGKGQGCCYEHAMVPRATPTQRLIWPKLSIRAKVEKLCHNIKCWFTWMPSYLIIVGSLYWAWIISWFSAWGKQFRMPTFGLAIVILCGVASCTWLLGVWESSLDQVGGLFYK